MTHEIPTGNEQDSVAPQGRSGSVFLFGLLLALATILAYLPLRHAGFIMDDRECWVGSTLMRRADGWYRFWCTTETPDYFPVTSTLMWLEWRLWGGNPLGYHVVNVLLHAFGAVLLWRVLARLKIAGAWLAAAIFALHPVNVESVAWISERKNVLAMVFCAFALLAYLRHEDADRRVGHACVPHNPDAVSPRASVPECASPSAYAARQSAAAARRRLALSKSKRFRWIGTALSRRGGTGAPIQAPLASEWRWYAAALGAFVLGMLSKAAVAPLPVVLLGMAWWRRGRIEWRDLRRSVPFFVVAAALALVTIWFQTHRAISSEIVRTDSYWSRLAGAGWAVWFYLSKALLPIHLSFVYPRWQIDAANLLSYAPGLGAAAGLLACWWQRRRWGKAWVFGLGYFVVMLLPVLGFVDMYFLRYSLVADHWQYFAIIGPIALAAFGIHKAISRFEGKTPWLGRVFCGLLLLAMGALTWRQCRVYTDSETLWRTTLASNPGCSMACNNLGCSLLDQGRHAEAIREFQKALEIQSDNAEAWNNLGNAFHQMGQTHNAIVQYQRALEIQPRLAVTHYNLGTVLLQNGQSDDALAHFQKAVEIQPNYADAQYCLGNVFFRRNRLDEAIAHYQKAADCQPDFADALNNLGWCLLQLGRTDKAIGVFQSALSIQPNDALARNNLAAALLQKGRAREAVAQYVAALKTQPENPDVLSGLAWVLATWPDTGIRNGLRAVELVQRANQLTGGQDPEVLGALAAAYAECGRFDEAIHASQQALALADSQTSAALADTLRSQISLYHAGSPLRSTSPIGLDATPDIP